MGGVVAKFLASEYAGHVLEENFGPQNPKYDILVTADGRRKKVKRATPTGISANDTRILTTIRRKAWRYEWWVDCHCCCGVHLQFGTVTLWGLLPVIGDFISLLNALGLIRVARRVDGGLPPHVLLAMMLWAAMDFALKLVPIVGDVVTAVIKPNTRNAMWVEALLKTRAEERRRGPLLVRGELVEDLDADYDDDVEGAAGSLGAPLLVHSQPRGAEGMRVTTRGGPAYGAVAVGGNGDGIHRESGRKGSRSLLPFWKKNEVSDSEEDGF
ncbi:hypothetical protein BD289DRAFT_420394 [Coniella lustricola]|uniref:Uncharacterized protein n=1 Tax=Coniella lustricola TaxID=2025994 RepID=A0A2T3AN76_9PEZI|nr:hypothetical protein BD289DRAFT_420394 [Coniella lustricola]